MLHHLVRQRERVAALTHAAGVCGGRHHHVDAQLAAGESTRGHNRGGTGPAGSHGEATSGQGGSVCQGGTGRSSASCRCSAGPSTPGVAHLAGAAWHREVAPAPTQKGSEGKGHLQVTPAPWQGSLSLHWACGDIGGSLSQARLRAHKCGTHTTALLPAMQRSIAVPGPCVVTAHSSSPHICRRRGRRRRHWSIRTGWYCCCSPWWGRRSPAARQEGRGSGARRSAVCRGKQGGTQRHDHRAGRARAAKGGRPATPTVHLPVNLLHFCVAALHTQVLTSAVQLAHTALGEGSNTSVWFVTNTRLACGEGGARPGRRSWRCRQQGRQARGGCSTGAMRRRRVCRELGTHKGDVGEAGLAGGSVVRVDVGGQAQRGSDALGGEPGARAVLLR